MHRGSGFDPAPQQHQRFDPGLAAEAEVFAVRVPAEAVELQNGHRFALVYQAPGLARRERSKRIPVQGPRRPGPDWRG
jgi:hypothetical protein